MKLATNMMGLGLAAALCAAVAAGTDNKVPPDIGHEAPGGGAGSGQIGDAVPPSLGDANEKEARKRVKTSAGGQIGDQADPGFGNEAGKSQEKSQGGATDDATPLGDEILPSCPADIDGDGRVDFDDIVEVLAAFGATGEPGFGQGPDKSYHRADLDQNGFVDMQDLLAVLSNYGAVCRMSK